MKKRLLPFGWAPSHWGLKGKIREVAKAEYELEGEELERKKVEINLGELSDKDLKLKTAELDFKYNKISKEEYNKVVSTIKEEPYVRVAEIKTDPADPAFGGIILDWNEAFVRHLEEHGYGPHPSGEATVEEWFNAVCRNIALEAFDGVGDFNERVEPRIRERDIITTEELERAQKEGKK